MYKKTGLLVMTVLLIASCKKETVTEPQAMPAVITDQTAPVITITGNSRDTVILQSMYTDPGATAIDDKDGDITAFIVTTGSVNAGLTGNYVKTYNVRDAAGNIAAPESRTVTVRNTADFLAGSYTVACKCQTVTTSTTFPDQNTVYSTTLVANQALNKGFVVSNLRTGSIDQVAFLNINGSSIDGMIGVIPSLSGTLSASKTSFTVNTITYDSNFLNGNIKCTNIYTKQ